MRKTRSRTRWTGPLAGPLVWLALSGAASLSAQTIDVCDRTAEVRDAITSETGEADCTLVTTAHLEEVATLDLNDQGLTSLREDDFDGLTRLKELNLGRNALTSLPAGVFSDLTKLRKVALRQNSLSSLPAGLFSGLPKLLQVDLSDNSLTSLPANPFSGLTKLNLISLAGNSLTSLDAGLFSGLAALQHLHLSDNSLTSLPAGLFADLTRLSGLQLSGNSLTSLPAGVFSDLGSLLYLFLDRNSLTSLPAGVFSDLTGLSILSLAENSLTSLPAHVFSASTRLGILDLAGNSLASLPAEAFVGITNLGSLRLGANSQYVLPLALELERVDDEDEQGLAAKVRVPSGAPFDLRVNVLMFEGGLLNRRLSVQVPAGATLSSSFSVVQQRDDAVLVSFGAQPSLPDDRCGQGPDNQPCFDGFVFKPGEPLVFSERLRLHLSPESISEDGGASTVTATVDPPSPTPFTVEVLGAPLEPVSSDFRRSANSVLTFAANARESTGVVTVAAVDDSAASPTKIIELRGDPSVADMPATAPVRLEIRDDEAPSVVVSFAATSYAVTEGGSVRVEARLSADPKRQVVVEVLKGHHGGANEADYGALPASLTFANGDTTAGFMFTAPADETERESGEMVSLYLQPQGDLASSVKVDGRTTIQIRETGGTGGGGGGGGGAGPPSGGENHDGEDGDEEDDTDEGTGDNGGGVNTPPVEPPSAGFVHGSECPDGLCRARTNVAVIFEDKSTGTVRLRTWSFGDGAKARSRRVEHRWAVPGYYEVTLEVSDGVVESTASQTFLVEASDPAGTCAAGEETLCVRDSRYAVEVDWWSLDGRSGAARVARTGTNDSGMFWFFNSDNWEVLIKVLDGGCSLNGHVWVFGASTTDLGYSIRVTDTVTGTVREYRNEPGRPAEAVADTTAFDDGCVAEGTPGPLG